MKIQNKPIAFRMTPAIIAYGLLVLNIVYILIPLTKKLSNIKRSLVFAISGLVYTVYIMPPHTLSLRIILFMLP